MYATTILQLITSGGPHPQCLAMILYAVAIFGYFTLISDKDPPAARNRSDAARATVTDLAFEQ